MRAYKIVPISIAVLLVTVLFAGVITVSVASTPLTASSGLSLSAGTTAPTVKQSVTFTATLKSGSTALSSKSVTIYHYLNSVRYNDATKTTNGNGQITLTTSFGSAGTRTYYATFAGDSSCKASTSTVVTVTVKADPKAQPSVTLSAGTTAPTVKQSVTFTATLKSGSTALSSKSVTIYHYLNSVRYNDATKTTNGNGQITLTTSFGSAGTRTYHATFAGDSSYQASTSTVVTVTVKAQTVDPPTNTQTIYYVPQAGSTWVNQGTAGASYNAYVSNPGSFQTQSNGYPYWGDDTSSDFVCIPAGSATNNQNVVSWEIGFHFSGVVAGQRYQKIWDKAYGGFFIEIDTNYGPNASYLTLYRATTGGSGARWYIPTTTALRAGHNYYIQIAWNTSAGPGHESYPTIWIGEDGKAPVLQTSWDESGGALAGTGSWYNDAVGSANLGNTASDGGHDTSSKIAALNGGIFVYRQFNSIVNFSNGGNWNTDKLRWA